MRQILSRARKADNIVMIRGILECVAQRAPELSGESSCDMFAITRSIDRKVNVQSPDKPEARICF